MLNCILHHSLHRSPLQICVANEHPLLLQWCNAANDEPMGASIYGTREHDCSLYGDCALFSSVLFFSIFLSNVSYALCLSLWAFRRVNAFSKSELKYSMVYPQSFTLQLVVLMDAIVWSSRDIW